MKPKRIQLSRKKGWRKPPNTVVVSRPGKWGNPYRVGMVMPNFYGPGQAETVRDNAHAVQLFRAIVINAWCAVIRPMRDIRELRGKNLACWCRPGQPCHADVLLEIANA